MAEERYVGGRPPKGNTGHRRQPSRRQGDAAALADPGDDQPVRVHQWMGARYLEHPERIDVNPAVVIGVAMGDPSGEEARRVNSPRVGRCVIGGGPSAGVPTLAPGVHAEVGPAGLGPDGVGVRVPPAARVAVVLDDRRQWTSSSGWYVQPGAHRESRHNRRRSRRTSRSMPACCRSWSPLRPGRSRALYRSCPARNRRSPVARQSPADTPEAHLG